MELQNEMNRDVDAESQSSQDPNAPPLPPPGWSFKHPSGTNSILMGSLLEIKEKPTSSIDVPKINEMYVSLLAHFQSKDPSLYDQHLDSCEYIPFTVRVYRTEKPTELWIRYAYVNSCLRIIGMTFPPTTHVNRTADQKPSNMQSISGMKDPVVRKSPWAPDLSLQTMVSLTDSIRGSAYVGPQFRKGVLNNEFHIQIEEFTCSVLGINDALGEFVAQACYFYEQKEYERWLGRIAHFVEPQCDMSSKIDGL